MHINQIFIKKMSWAENVRHEDAGENHDCFELRTAARREGKRQAVSGEAMKLHEDRHQTASEDQNFLKLRAAGRPAISGVP